MSKMTAAVESLATKVCRRCGENKPSSAFSPSRQTSDGLYPYCKSCKSSYMRANVDARRDEVNRRARERYVPRPRTPRRQSMTPEELEQRRAIECEYAWRRNLRRYGLTPEEYERMLAAQGGRCAICRTGSPGKRFKKFAVDHCHETGVIRGLLCHRCNVALGQFDDDTSVLLEAVRYLQKGKCNPRIPNHERKVSP